MLTTPGREESETERRESENESRDPRERHTVGPSSPLLMRNHPLKVGVSAGCSNAARVNHDDHRLNSPQVTTRIKQEASIAARQHLSATIRLPEGREALLLFPLLLPEMPAAYTLPPPCPAEGAQRFPCYATTVTVPHGILINPATSQLPGFLRHNAHSDKAPGSVRKRGNRYRCKPHS